MSDAVSETAKWAREALEKQQAQQRAEEDWRLLCEMNKAVICSAQMMLPPSFFVFGEGDVLLERKPRSAE